MSSHPAPPRGLAHISLAVADAEKTAASYVSYFGAEIKSRETLQDRGIRVLFLDIAGIPIELVEPMNPDDESNTVAKFIKRRGEGLHHFALTVDDAQAALDAAAAEGAELVDKTPRPGAENCLVAFLHPRSTSGALVEFVQPQSSNAEEGAR